MGYVRCAHCSQYVKSKLNVFCQTGEEVFKTVTFLDIFIFLSFGFPKINVYLLLLLFCNVIKTTKPKGFSALSIYYIFLL